MKNILRQAVVIGGATIGAAFATEAAANTTCGCGGSVKIDESRTFSEAKKDATDAAIRHGIKNKWCHIMGHGSKSGENYMSYFDGNSFNGWVKFSGKKTCPTTPIEDTPKKPKVVIETPVVEKKKKFVIDLNDAPRVCKPYIDKALKM